MTKQVGSLLISAALLLVGACSGADEVSVDDERPDTIALASTWMYNFTSLEEMAATASLVVSGEVTAVERGRTLNADDPMSTTITVRDVTITIAETLRGTAPGATVVIEEEGHFDDGTSFEYAEMPWSRVGDKGVYFLAQSSSQPDDRYIQIVPDGRILTHRHVDGQSQIYETAEVFSHSALGEVLGELAPDGVANRVRQSVTTVVGENIQPQKSIYEVLAELEAEDDSGTRGNTGNSGGGRTPSAPGDGIVPSTPGGSTSDNGGNDTTGQETPL